MTALAFFCYASILLGAGFLDGNLFLPHLAGALFTFVFCVFLIRRLRRGGRTRALFSKPKPRLWLFATPLCALAVLNLCYAEFSAPDALFCLKLCLAAIAEELLFRAVLFRDLEKRVGGAGAVLLSSLLFGSLHAANLLSGAAPGDTLLQIALAFAAGCAFCTFTLLSGSLFPAMAAHLAINLTSLFVSDAQIPPALFLLAAVFYLALAALYYHLYTRRTASA